MPTGISIHIGLNDLDEAHYRGRFSLRGCLADAQAMRDLAAAAGFEPRLITAQSATADAVLAAIADARRRVRTDGMLLVTFSGHGGRVKDLGNQPMDEDVRDGWDETWCLYDRELVDDELYECWADFPPGARVLVVSDSCFSGDMIRDDARARTLPAPGKASLWGTCVLRETTEALRALRSGAIARTSAALALAKRPRTRGGQPRMRALPGPASQDIYDRNRALYDGIQRRVHSQPRRRVHADVMLLAAAQDNEPAADGDVNGAFTAALLEVWNKGAFQGDYVALHAELRRRLVPGQHPILAALRSPSFAHQRPFSI
ncbi:MAG TPA: caspase family protein [Longimicrobium sp.]|nr:caspase family protein [Longimicrobium sp.]